MRNKNKTKAHRECGRAVRISLRFGDEGSAREYVRELGEVLGLAKALREVLADAVVLGLPEKSWRKFASALAERTAL